ncbi:peptidoglycan-binding protein [Streptomyces sp. NBC_01476]|uniref:peptidoglycan-binding domain-containing protein n=1 Tax=Streptomyces sp. NBC_01476 TaxID=2903881 RepID=UPI002E3767C7|nr:peptidoglycan-binding domain-containing protein [Streptomyces sp. NBC_01476]
MAEGADGTEVAGAAEEGVSRAAERSAQRAAALAATEGFHPLRLRPYVAEPDEEPGETTARPLIATEHDPDGPATADLGLFPSMYSGVEYAPEEPPAAEPLVIRGRHRRRRRGIVVAAATVAASALAAGAVAVTGQVMGDEQADTERALPDLSTSMPDVELPHDASPATAKVAPPVSRAAPASPAPTATATTTAPVTPAATPSATPATSAPATTAPAGTPTTTPAVPPTTTPPPPLQPNDAPAPATLGPGDSGPEVADLQRALTAAHLYRGPIDGVYTLQVQLAVTAFQFMHHIHASPMGSYDQATRAALTSSHHR